MYFKDIIEKYGKGASDAKMKEISILLSDYIAETKDANKKNYWYLMRKIYGILSGGHYNEDFAMHDVAEIEYTDNEGKAHKGAYWTCEQVEEATKDMNFPIGTTKWDKFVAFNLAKSDFCKKFNDADILIIGYLFFFADEDWSADEKSPATKTWNYICCKNQI